MTQPLRIDFIPDIYCPWCAIGLSALQFALSRLSDDVTAEIVLHPFELNPQMRPEGEAIVDYLGRKYGRTPEQIEETQRMIRQRGESVGFAFSPRTQVYNTFDAHRLLHWVGIEGRQMPLTLALLRAYHGEGRNPGDHEVLIDLAQSVGLDAARARGFAKRCIRGRSARTGARQRSDGHRVRSGDHLQPAHLVSGGQPPEAFEQAIRQVLGEPQH